MAISLVQHASNTAVFANGAGSSGTISATFGASTTAGNCLIACFSFFYSTSTKTGFSPTVSSVKIGTAVENWASAASSTTNNFDQAWIYADPNTGGGQTVVNVVIAFGATPTSFDQIGGCLDIYEVSGLTTTTPVDKTSSGSSSGSGTATSWSSGSTATTTQAAEFWVGVGALIVTANNTTETVTGPSSPWTNETLLHIQADSTSGGSVQNCYQLSGFQVVASTGAAVYSGTNSQNSNYGAVVVTLKGAAAPVNVNLTVAQVNISAPAPGITVSVPLTVAQVNINAPAPKLGAGPLALSVAQVNINARAPGLVANPVSLAVAQVNINARAPGVGPVSLSLPVAQVTINAQPFIIGKSFAITTAGVTITAYPPAITRPGVIEDTIVPMMATGVYSNV